MPPQEPDDKVRVAPNHAPRDAVSLCMTRCAVDGCENESKSKSARGWCGMHYARWRRHGDPLAVVKVRGECSIDGCDRPHCARGYCRAHYYRVKTTGDPGPAEVRLQRPGATRYVNERDGYVRIKVEDHPRASRGWIREHLVVMEHTLGRYLLPGEEVHHRNGVKIDNRPENLELWVVSQPKGQRPADLVEWAREILARYEGTDHAPGG